tara:strand:+ start:1221 stop:1922 length:702 start_codon:yes stop_codon:yes gene_type:complete
MSLIFKQLFERESCTYTYLIADSDSKEAAIVDAVDIMMERDKALLEELELDLKFIIETHIHADHITSACPLKKYYPNARIVIGMENVDAEACSDIMVNEGHILNIGRYEITTIETPGHTIGCISYLVENKLLTGDALFIRSTGRCDFQGGSAESLYNSIQKLFKLPDTTEVYPAHDYNGLSMSTIGEEKRFNTMIKESYDRKAFIKNVNNLDLGLPKKIKVAVPANQSCGFIS